MSSPAATPNQTSGFHGGGIRLEKTSLPTCSGKRSEWPEFKAVWRSLAEPNIHDRSALAYQLKSSLRGSALEKVRNVYVTRPNAHDLLWSRLSEFYDDTSACVQSALDTLNKLKPLKEDNYKGVVYMVNQVEAVHAQLQELGQLGIVTMREVDKLSDLLPASTKMLWMRIYHQLSQPEKLHPFDCFLNFLLNERASVARLAEVHKKVEVSGTTNYGSQAVKKNQSCVVHPEGTHKTSECR